MVGLVELGKANVTVDTAGRLLSALGLTVNLRVDLPFADPRQRDAGHARCVAYVQRRLERDGWLVQREVEIVHGRSHGWIDLLAFNPHTRTLLVVEVKTELHDVGRIERTVGWYEREAWAAAHRLGWRAAHVRGLLLVLASEASDVVIVANRQALAQSFPTRAMAVLTAGTRGLALIDPSSRRRDWLLRSRADGRRSAAPYRDYADFVRRSRGGSRG